MIVLDASVLIAYLEGEDEHHGAAEALLAREIDDDFGANPLTLAEVLVVPARDDRLDEARLALREVEVEELPFPGDTAVKLALLRSETGLKMPDCCVLLAAEQVGGRLASFDDGLRKAAVNRNVQTVAP
ncbi:MAG TPA: type II toxin-antitoxin system VapC family toxin [Acidimicrobiales bacterium]|nr:type II toxin-antitoxin system VapC family toxin [Acidimicrobiales bacterium]